MKQAAKDAFEPLKTNLLSETPDWVAKNDDLKTKKTALDDAKHKYAEKLVASGKAKTAATKAIAAARCADAGGLCGTARLPDRQLRRRLHRQVQVNDGRVKTTRSPPLRRRKY